MIVRDSQLCMGDLVDLNPLTTVEVTRELMVYDEGRGVVFKVVVGSFEGRGPGYEWTFETHPDVVFKLSDDQCKGHGEVFSQDCLSGCTGCAKHIACAQCKATLDAIDLRFVDKWHPLCASCIDENVADSEAASKASKGR